MKHYYSFVLFLFALQVSSYASAQGRYLSALEEKNGFRGTKLGTKFSLMKGTLVPAPEGGLFGTRFTRRQDVMLLGDIPLQKIDYEFHGDRLGRILISFKGAEHNPEILKTLVTAYGKWSETQLMFGGTIMHVWESRNITLLLLDCPKQTNSLRRPSGSIIFATVKYEQLQADMEKAKKKSLEKKRVNGL